MNTKILTIILLVLFVTPLASADWSQFHGDPEHTGNVSGDAPLTDTLLWKTKPTPTEVSFIGCSASIVDRRVYVSNWLGGMGSGDHLGLFCLNNSTGEILWTNPIGGLGGASTPAISGDRVFVGSHAGDLYCVNITDRATIWHETIETNPSFWGVASSPLIYDDAVFVNSFSDATLHAFDFNGNELWEINTPNNIDHYVSPAAEGDKIFFAGGDPALYCVNISNQSILWRFNTSDDIKTTPSIDDDVVFFATKSRMHAVDMDGSEVWNHSLSGTISSPAIAYGKVYIGSSDGVFYCFNATDGNEIWNKSVNGKIDSSPAVADGTVYFGTNTGHGTVYALNATDGTVRWSYNTGNNIMSSPSVSDEIMFIGSDTGYLYAFGTPEKFWKGSMVLLEGKTINVTAENSGINYTINRTTSLGALAKAAGYGGFNFTINDSCLAFVDSIADVSNNETEGKYWRYHVNYHLDDPEPTIAANEFELNASSTARDVVTFYYGEEEITPENSTMAIEITTQIIKKKPEVIFITIERHEFIEDISKRSNSNITLLYPSDIQTGINFTGYDLIFLEHIGGETAEKLKNPIETANGTGVPIISIHSDAYDDIFGNVNLTEHPFIKQYWDNYNETNIARLLSYLEVNFCGLIGNIKDPFPIPDAFIHHPDAPQWFFDTGEYLKWYSDETNKTGYHYNQNNITIGIANWHESTKSPEIEKLIHTLEEKGANVISIGFTGTDHLKKFYLINNNTIVDAIICTKSFRINFDDSDQGVADLKTLDVPVMKAVRLYYMPPSEWRNETSHGISIMDLGFQVGLPELDGIIDPIVIAGKNVSDSTYLPIDEQINWTADRAISWGHLRHVPDEDKKVAMIYYNHGGGKDNIGACYVNVPPSLQNILNAMNLSGYTVKGEIPNETTLVRMMTLNGTNIGTWAPGELEKLVESGTATLIPVENYTRWFSELEVERQEEAIERWGEPPGEIMTWTNETTGDEYFVIPKLSFGNVILTPQPTRGWLQNNTVLYHNKDIPPHHQYIAFYLWLKHEFGADAIIHFGKHGTQEWLPGKETGLSSRDCWPSILIQDIPVVYPYIVDNIAEGTQAKRRGSATMITHLTPPIVASGSYGNYTNLLKTINDYYLAAGDNASQEGYKEDIISTSRDLHLDEDLCIDDLNATAENDTAFTDFITELADYLYDLKNEFMPYGLHTFGEPPACEPLPDGEPLISLIESMLRKGYKGAVADRIEYYDYPNSTKLDKNLELDNCTAKLLEYVILNGTTPEEAENLTFSNYSQNENATANITRYLNRSIVFTERIANCTIEIQRTLEGLNGSYIPPSTADDPIRDPDALPTGRNFHSLNPDRIPTETAYKIGTKMADALIECYRADHSDEYPRKLTIVLWAWCTTDGGVVESEILRLVGAEPVRDEYDKVINVTLIPVSELSELGRPRIDVMVVPSGLERDFAPNALKLIDRAIRLAATANDTYPNGTAYPNYVKENSDAIFEVLNKTGSYTEEEARYLSMSRIFLEAPGTYGPNLDSAIGASGTWNNSSRIGELFISRMNYIYGDNVWGTSGEEMFRLNLAGTDAIVHNTNSNLYGFIDNDDVFQYVGGLALAYTASGGEGSPDFYVTDNRDPDGNPTASTLESVIQRELRTRYFNPKWIEGMMGEGYAGGREMSKFVEYLWGWEATIPGMITDNMWQQVYDVYVNGAYISEYNLDINTFIDTNNPYAYQSMTGRMLEAIRKEYWSPSSDEVLNTLVYEYVESVVNHGVTCCHHTCGNPFLDEFVSGVISVPGADVVSDETYAKYRKIVDAAAGKTSVNTQTTNDDSGRGTENQGKIISAKGGDSNQTEQGSVGESAQKASESSKHVEGYEMEVQTVSDAASSAISLLSGAPFLAAIIVVVLLAAIYGGYRRR
ncbi:MAG: Outer membrane protein assembly factor BamB [Candidatus Argoarchaeum ethanivorans]|uniref:Outer membrane protein assembly factor BamB n=1 Tax=Candidatus Argoarchaeum ethanivorans TaxID=2608793 RepID=A0A812A1C8_9EURY|nr:MAG: Outer membrane protein assembly factor BamB [Candidatus Argoarchaeum ethanivorans]